MRSYFRKNIIKKNFILYFLTLCIILMMPVNNAFAARVAGEDAPVATSDQKNEESRKVAPAPVPAKGPGRKAAQEGTARSSGPQPGAVQAQVPPPNRAPAAALPGGKVSPQKKPTPAMPPKAADPKPAAPAAIAEPGKTVAPLPSKPELPQSVPASRPAKEPRYVTIDFDNVDIQVFIKFISELTGRNFVVDDKVKGKVTILSPKKISVEEAYKVFESVLDTYGFTAVPSGDVTKIIPVQQAKEKSIETRLQDEGFSAEDRIVTQIISLDHASPDEMKKVLDPLISKSSVVLSYPPTGMLVITDVLSNIRRLVDIVSALDVEGVGEQISFIPLKFASAADVVKSLTAVFQQQKGSIAPVRAVPDDRTNSVIVLASEMETVRVKELIGFMDKEVPRGEAVLHVYRLQNANAEDLAKVLMNIPKDARDGAQKGKTPVLSKEVYITADKATNTLIITAAKDDFRVLESVIAKLDTPRPMVYIEALIMEVRATKDFQLGVEWHAIKDVGTGGLYNTGSLGAFAGSGTGSKSGIIPSPDSTTGAMSFPTGFSVGILGAGIKIGGVVFNNIGAVLRAIQTDNDVSIISTPQIMTLDNEEAEVNVSENVPYITRQERSVSNVDYSNYEYKDVGVILKITPHINEEKFVRLKIDQQITRLISQTTATILAPTTFKRTAKTTVVVKDSETVVIGGLISDNTVAGTYKVPCLGNIPLIGWLFKQVSNNREKTNLYVFITPHIVRNQKDAAAIYKDKKARIGEVEEGVIKMYEKPLKKK